MWHQRRAERFGGFRRRRGASAGADSSQALHDNPVAELSQASRDDQAAGNPGAGSIQSDSHELSQAPHGDEAADSIRQLLPEPP